MCKVNAQELKAASTFASKDYSRPVLTYVALYTNGDNYEIASTDSYRLIVFTRYGYVNKEDENTKKYMIESDRLKSIKANVENLEFHEQDGKLNVDFYNRNTSIPIVDHTETWPLNNPDDYRYPNYRQLIPEQEGEGSIYAINPAYMGDVCKAVATAYKKEKPPVTVKSYTHRKPIIFEARVQDRAKMTALVMPIREA